MSDAERHDGEPIDPTADEHATEAGQDHLDDPKAADDAVADGADASDPADSEAGDVAAELDVEEDVRTRDELIVELAEAESRRDEYLDDLRRARAEFENFRRRTMKEGATQRHLGRADVLESLLEVLDDLDRTLEAADVSADDGLAKGIQLVAEKLVHALRSQGLERVDQTGIAFDPTVHEAVQQVEGEVDEPTVSQVLRPGYRSGDRVLRAAMVVVEQ